MVGLQLLHGEERLLTHVLKYGVEKVVQGHYVIVQPLF
jgi:hypothetical protein